MCARDVAVGHLDADCFYVSAERLRDPSLIGKPVGVLSNQAACVISKSYEMKDAGVRTGMPVWEARAKCPQGIYILRDFRWYGIVSKRMLAVLRDLSPRVEYYSIDEFFFTVVPQGGETWSEAAARIRDRVFRTIGVPVTVGISRTRTLAKLVSDGAKPFGAQAVFGPEDEERLLARLPVTEVAGIAGRRARRLAYVGIETCLDFVRADRRLVRSILTTAGEVLWWELNGEPVQPIRTRSQPHKTLSRGGSFGGSTTDPVVLYAWLVRNLERLIEELEYHHVCAGRLTVSVLYKDGRAGVGQTRPVVPSARFDVLLEAARPGLRQAWIRHARAERMFLTADDLTPSGSVQLGLFEVPDDRSEAIDRLKREVNSRIGRFALRSGATLPLTDLYLDEADRRRERPGEDVFPRS